MSDEMDLDLRRLWETKKRLEAESAARRAKRLNDWEEKVLPRITSRFANHSALHDRPALTAGQWYVLFRKNYKKDEVDRAIVDLLDLECLEKVPPTEATRGPKTMRYKYVG